MLKKIIFISLSLILFSIITNSTIAKVSFKEIFSSGVGKTYEEALNNAFAEAISMVNGKSVQTQTIIKIMSGQTLPSAKSNASASEEEELYGTINKILSDVFDVDEKKKEEVPKDVLKKEKKQTSNLTQQYLKEMIDKTKGGIKSYEIINKKEKKGIHTIKIKAQVAVFDLPESAKRTRIAVMPFRLNKPEEHGEKIIRLLSQEINNYLVQTRKFTILDRDFLRDLSKEKESILDGKAPVSEMAKLGNEISADFLFLGFIENFSIDEIEKKFKTTDKVIKKNNAYIYLNYRLVDVATNQIYHSNILKTNYTSKGNKDVAVSAIIEAVSKKIGEDIIFAIYPVLVEKIDGETVYLGQGGNQFSVGQKYEMLEKGDKIIDSYTNEVIGNIEKLIGTVEIAKVSQNISEGKIIEKKNDLSGFEVGKFLLRPIKLDENKKTFKEKKEKIIEKRKEKEEKLEDVY